MKGTLARRCAAWLLAAAAMLLPVTSGIGQEDRKAEIFAIVDRNAQSIAEMSDAVYYFAELGMQEIESAKLVAETLRAAGFRVSVGDHGFPTNVWAEWGSGKPKITIVTEIDALPEGSQTPGEFTHKPLVPGAPGHMEGHNTHAGVAVGAAFALKQVMEKYKVPGTIALSFGPAEEQLLSRPFLVRAGAFKDTDAAILLHIGDRLSTGYGLMNYGAIGATFGFRGQTAHGAVAPWLGRDAVDAVVLMDTGVNALREHLRPSARAHRTITAGGVQPNVIPDYGQSWWFVRDANASFTRENFDKVVNVARGAAMMTGTTMEMEINASAWPQLGNRALAEVIQRNIDRVGMPRWSAEEVDFAKRFQKARGLPEIGLHTTAFALGARPQGFASNDNGDVTWVVPAANLNFPGIVPGVTIHHWAAGVAPTHSLSHKGQVAGAKTLAATMLDLLTDPAALARARAQFATDTKDVRYQPFIPPEAKPPLELNREMQAKYRPALEKFYTGKRPVFR